MHRFHVEQLLTLGITNDEFENGIPYPSLEIPTSGEPSGMNVTEITRIRDIAARILHDEETYRKKEEIFKQKIEEEMSRIQERRQQLEDSGLLEKYKRYVHTKYKINLLSIAKQMQLLATNEDIRNVPNIVCNILEISSDMVLPSSMKIRQVITQQSNVIAKSIVRKFQEIFENQLQINISIDSSKNLPERSAASMLGEFFKQAQDWLLGFAMVSMLPFAVSTDSKSQCIVKYQDVLDECLTPLWGRFHFHLTSARVTNSDDQIFWSFNYAKSFVDLMVDICRRISKTGQLQRLYSGDYDAIGVTYVVEKSMRFMRSHIALILETLVPDLHDYMRGIQPQRTDINSFVISVIEHTLDYDSQIHSSGYPLDVTLSTVIFDVKVIHSHWVDTELSFYKDRIKDMISRDIFSSQFGSQVCDLVKGFEQTELSYNTDFQLHYSGYRCYRGVYECLSLFHLASRRYTWLAPLSQDIFAIVVLEPLLLLSLALFLYRIRSDKILYKLSLSKNSSAQENRSIMDPDEETEAFSILSEFTASSQYFQSSLSSVDEISKKIAVKDSRFDDRWKKVQYWIPKRYLDINKADQSKYSPSKLVDAVFNEQDIMKFSTKASDGSNDNDSRPSMTSNESSMNSIGSLLTNRKGVGILHGNLGNVIDQVKSLASSMCLVLESQYQSR